MTNALKFDLTKVTPIADPSTDTGEISFFADALGQDGRPFVLMVEDPPNKTRERHYHHGDVLYVYIKGEHHIEGEATYRAGDLRWTRAGHVYGPETTGPDGGAWWVISYSDPTPVDCPIDSDEEEARQQAMPHSFDMPHFGQPYDWQAIDTEIKTIGGVILDGFLKSTEAESLNKEIDQYLETNHKAGNPKSGSARYDLFLGHKTIRLHGLISKVPATINLIGNPSLVEWATRMLKGKASSVLLNAGELIQIQPGEPPQFAHRDTDSWPLPIDADPVIVNAIVALDDFTSENGATKIAPSSWNWEPKRQPTADEYSQAIMNKGDALLFRGDLIHGGGGNKSNSRRRALSISYCAGWLRPVENSFLNLSMETVRELPEQLQSLLGYSAYDGSDKNGGLIGLYENGDPGKALEQNR